MVIVVGMLYVAQTVNAMRYTGERVADWINARAEAGRRDVERNFVSNQVRHHQLMREIDELAAINVNHPGIAVRQAEIARMQGQENVLNNFANTVGNTFGQAATLLINEQGAEHRRAEIRDREMVRGIVANKRKLAELEAWLKTLKDPKVLATWAAALAGTTLGVVGAYYTAKIGYQYVDARMGKPALVRESSRVSVWLELQRVFGFNLPPEAKLTDIVLEPAIEKQVYALADDTKLVREYGLTYQNMLYYGPPGTGKTEFAKTVAHYADMDYAIMSGADFSQFKGGEGITEMHKLFDWAEASERGLIIFIDEADACFRDRSTLDKDGVNLVNAFLSRTGASSDKFMIILATNYEDELDGAVRSRIHKKIPFMLPALEQRFKIMQKKIDKYIIDDIREVVREDGTQVTYQLTFADDVNESYLRNVAQRIDGFSGRDIDQFIAEVRLATYRSGNLFITREVFDYVINEKIKQIEKDKQTTEYQRARARKQGNAVALPAGAPVAAVAA
ncbi:AAA family ATPase [Candidatus Dependentiae bacterium]|nr:AAA family ATPase [Candidatus Dependentiae bacterium]